MTETAAEMVQDAPAIFAEWMKGHGLSLRYEFIPYSRSRNAPQDGSKGWKSLNWKYTLVKTANGRESIITTGDYSAGTGHCPATRKPQRYPTKVNPGTVWHDEMIGFEIEEGFPARMAHWGCTRQPKASPIVPNDSDVMRSLADEAGVIDYRSFEDWAGEFGYDVDSRKAEAEYKTCLATALALRNGLGESALAELQGRDR